MEGEILRKERRGARAILHILYRGPELEGRCLVWDVTCPESGHTSYQLSWLGCIWIKRCADIGGWSTEALEVQLACGDILLRASCRRDAGCAGKGSGSIHQRPRPSDCRHDRGVTIDSFPSSAPQRRHPARQRRFRHRNFSPVGKTRQYFYSWI